MIFVESLRIVLQKDHQQQVEKNKIINSIPFTQKECQEIMNMLSKTKPHMSNYIGNLSINDELLGKALCFSSPKMKAMRFLDNGATSHITYCLQLLTTCRPIKNKTMKLLNGSLANVTHMEEVVFFFGLVLDNVLCIPIFKLNFLP